MYYVSDCGSFFVDVEILGFLHAISDFAVLFDLFVGVLLNLVLYVSGFCIYEFMVLREFRVYCAADDLAYCVPVVSEDAWR